MLCFAAPGVCASSADLTGTEPLTWEGDLCDRMMQCAHRFIERKIAESACTREKFWKRDISSRGAYEASVEPNRRLLMKNQSILARLPCWNDSKRMTTRYW